MSITGWMNSINRENSQQWEKLHYDEVAVDFVKTLRKFPLLRAWADAFAKELLMVLDIEQCEEYHSELKHFCCSFSDEKALHGLTKTIYIDFSAYHFLSPLRQRLEQYLKSPPKRTPGILEDFYAKNINDEEFYEDILRSSRTVFKPCLQNFWNPQDIEEMTKIRNSLFDFWEESDFEIEDAEYLETRIRFCLALRMDIVEMTAAMNITGGDQWIEVITSFLRRTTLPEGFDLTDEPKNPRGKKDLVDHQLFLHAKVINLLCSEIKGIPEKLLESANNRGLGIPPYASFYERKENST